MVGLRGGGCLSLKSVVVYGEQVLGNVPVSNIFGLCLSKFNDPGIQRHAN